MPPSTRDVLLRDIFMHYDRDQSGDLDRGELKQLLAAAGLGGLSEGEVRGDGGDEEGGRRDGPVGGIIWGGAAAVVGCSGSGRSDGGGGRIIR